MNKTVTIKKSDFDNLLGYIYTLLDLIDVEGFEDEENRIAVIEGYNKYVSPLKER